MYQPWDTWRLSRGVMRPHYYQLFRPTLHLEQSFTQMSGQPIDTFRDCPLLRRMGYIVNHSLHFIEPNTGVHTQNIESYWSRVKTKRKRMRGCHEHQLPSYMDEYMWQERFGHTARDTLQNIMANIAIQYPV